MPYSTGTSLTLNDLYDSLVAFMVGCGWTVSDTITTRDKVLTSTGSDGKRNMVYRLTASTEAGNPSKYPGDYAKHFKSISVRGYHAWDAGTHTGTNEFGWIGPIIDALEENNDTGLNKLYRPKIGTTSANTKALVSWGFGVALTRNAAWDGHRMMMRQAGTTLAFNDVPFKARVNTSAALGASSTMDGGGGCFVHDAATDKTYAYQILAVTTDADTFQRYDIEAASWSRVAAIPWTVTPSNSMCLWDGADYLYVMPGAGTTDFYRYTISTGAWTTLASAPAARVSLSSRQPGNRDIYVPNSVTGIGEDVIYSPQLNSGTVIYRYDVTSDAWRGAGAGALVAPVTLTSGCNWQWDYKRYAYFMQPASGVQAFYTTDLTAGPGAFANLGTLQADSGTAFTAMKIRDSLATVLKACETQEMTFHFLGDSDTVVVAVNFTTSAGSRWYWIYMGKYAAHQRDDVMTLTAGASAGTRATITVDDSSEFFAGDKIQVWDPSTGLVELTTIYDVPDATSVRANLVNAYTTGSRVGTDVCQAVLTGDSYMAAAPIGPTGYRVDDWYDHYQVNPSQTDTDSKARNAPGTRGTYVAIPLQIFSNTSTLNNYESLGVLYKVGACSIGTYPLAQSGDMLRLGNHNYLIFKPSTHSVLTEQHGIIMGPLE